MKLRMQSNSIRLRLKRGEVAQLVEEGHVEETLIFGNDQTLKYRLQVSREVETPCAHFQSGEVLVEVPADMASQWASGNEVGIEASQITKGKSNLQILIEKDFACLNGNDEQNIDTFPNPLAGTPC